MAEFIIVKVSTALSSYDVIVRGQYYGTLFIDATTPFDKIRDTLYERAKTVLPKLHLIPGNEVRMVCVTKLFTKERYSKTVKFSDTELASLINLRSADQRDGTNLYTEERKRMVEEAERRFPDKRLLSCV